MSDLKFWQEVYRGMMLIVAAIVKYKLKGKPVEAEMKNPDYLNPSV